MTLGKSMWVSCDGAPGEECDEEVVVMGQDAIAGRTRHAARLQGWTYDAVTNLDLCPKHREKRPS